MTKWSVWSNELFSSPCLILSTGPRFDTNGFYRVLIASFVHSMCTCSTEVRLSGPCLGALSPVDVGVGVAPVDGEDVLAVVLVDCVLIVVVDVVDVSPVGVVPVEGVGVCL